MYLCHVLAAIEHGATVACEPSLLCRSDLYPDDLYISPDSVTSSCGFVFDLNL